MSWLSKPGVAQIFHSTTGTFWEIKLASLMNQQRWCVLTKHYKIRSPFSDRSRSCRLFGYLLLPVMYVQDNSGVQVKGEVYCWCPPSRTQEDRKCEKAYTTYHTLWIPATLTLDVQQGRHPAIHTFSLQVFIASPDKGSWVPLLFPTIAFLASCHNPITPPLPPLLQCSPGILLEYSGELQGKPLGHRLRNREIC